MKFSSLTVFLCIAAFLNVVSCAEPTVQDFFVRADNGSEYLFDVDMSDSLAVYDYEFYAASGLRKQYTESLRLDIKWEAPDTCGTSFESVYLPAIPAKGIRTMYREGVCPPHSGIWRLEVSIPNQPEHFPGLGLIVTKRKQ